MRASVVVLGYCDGVGVYVVVGLSGGVVVLWRNRMLNALTPSGVRAAA